VIEDMFGGPHRKDEVTRTEQLGWSARNQNGPQRGVPAKQRATALANGCASMTQNSQRISLDTADFVRHIPYPINAKGVCVYAPEKGTTWRV